MYDKTVWSDLVFIFYTIFKIAVYLKLFEVKVVMDGIKLKIINTLVFYRIYYYFCCFLLSRHNSQQV